MNVDPISYMADRAIKALLCKLCPRMREMIDGRHALASVNGHSDEVAREMQDLG